MCIRDSVYIPYKEVYGLGIDDMLHRVPALEKIKGAIGWEPKFGLDEILRDVIEDKRRVLALDEQPVES